MKETYRVRSAPGRGGYTFCRTLRTVTQINKRAEGPDIDVEGRRYYDSRSTSDTDPRAGRLPFIRLSVSEQGTGVSNVYFPTGRRTRGFWIVDVEGRRYKVRCYSRRNSEQASTSHCGSRLPAVNKELGCSLHTPNDPSEDLQTGSGNRLWSLQSVVYPYQVGAGSCLNLNEGALRRIPQRRHSSTYQLR